MGKILIVEDNATFRKTVRGLLESRFPSADFEEAEDGVEALRKVNEFHPDLIFMDIKLPGENGLALTKRIKGSDPQITIIILTSHDLPEYRQAASKMGASHFVVKGSSTADEILALVASIYSESQRVNDCVRES